MFLLATFIGVNLLNFLKFKDKGSKTREMFKMVIVNKKNQLKLSTSIICQIKISPSYNEQLQQLPQLPQTALK